MRLIKILKAIAIVLLLFNGIGALVGGSMLIADPTGASMGLQLRFLQHGPFVNYLMPGIILFSANGLLSIGTVIITVLNRRFYPEFIFLQGCILSGWIMIQMVLIQIVFILHYVMGITGLLLIASGVILRVLLMRRSPLVT